MKYLLIKILIIGSLSYAMLFAQANDFAEDIEGNTYAVITIGNQYWMAENLKVTRFNDGNPIQNITDDREWWLRDKPAFSWMDNDREKYIEDYGALYNWYAVDSGKLCPVGWKIPTDSDWQELIDYLGGEDVAGDKLKIKGADYWKSQNVLLADEVKFSALPGGLRYFRGFYTTGINGTWWSSTEHSKSDAWYRTIDYKFRSIDRYYYDKSTGLSVRCIMNNHAIKK